MKKELNRLYIAIGVLIALFLAFSCNAQGLDFDNNKNIVIGGILESNTTIRWDTTTAQSIKYAQPRLERVTINGEAVYIQVWDLIPAEYITYSFDARHFDAQHMPEVFADTTINDVVTRVHDGDSYYLKGMADFVRIAGVDAPEIYWGPGTKDQEFGRAIGDSVRLALKGKNVTYAFLGLDALKRPLVSLYIDGVDFAETMLAKGWCWSYGTRKLPSAVNKRYKALMNEAKKKKKGLWISKNPVKPWAHRSDYKRVWP